MRRLALISAKGKKVRLVNWNKKKTSAKKYKNTYKTPSTDVHFWNSLPQDVNTYKKPSMDVFLLEVITPRC